MSDILRRPWIETSIQQKLEEDIKGFKTRDIDFPQIHLGNGKPVQVLDFLSTSVAYVSDSKTKVRAKICSRNSAEPTRGSIITVKRCKLLFDPTSKRSDQLLLEIEDFKVLGCENSAPFGHPVDILRLPTIAKALNQIRALILLCDAEDTPLSQLTPPCHVKTPMTRRASTQMEPNTQQDFATQTTELLGKGPCQTTIQVERARSGKDDLLRALLEAPKPQPPHENDVKAKMISAENAIKAAESPFKLPQISHEEALLQMPKVEISANVRQYQSSQPSHISSLQHSLPTPKATNADIVAIEACAESEKENDQDTIAQTHVAKSTAIVTLSAIEETHNPFAGLTRMPRNLVRISREQQELLDQEDSWHDPSAPSRASYATIPVKVREGLNSFMNNLPRQTRDGIPSDPITVSDDTDDNPESENESHRSLDNTANYYEQIRTSPQDAAGTQFATINETEESETGNSSDEDSAPSMMISLRLPSENYDSSMHGDIIDKEDNSEGISEPSPAANRHRTLATLGETSQGLYQPSASEHEEGEAVTLTSPSPATIKLQSVTRRAPLPDYYPSSAPEQDLELDELHAEGDEVEHDEGGEIQIHQPFQLLPSTAPSKLKLVQVERSPFNDMNLNVPGDENKLSVSRPSSVKNIEVLHEAPSSDPVVVATYENISPETKITEAALNNEQHILESREMDDSTTGCLPCVRGTRPPERMAIESRDALESDEDIRTSPPSTANLAKFSLSLPTNLQSPTRKSKSCAVQSSKIESISARPMTLEVICTPAESTATEKEFDKMPSPNLPVSLYRGSTERRLAVEEAIQEEEFTRRNTKEMARAARRQFNFDCLAVERELPPTNLRPPNPRPLPMQAEVNITPTQYVDHLTSPQQGLPVLHNERPLQNHQTPSVQAMPQNARHLGTELSYKPPSDQQHNTSKQASSPKSNRTSSNSTSSDRSQDGFPVLDAHQQFLATYPNYAGSRNNFTWALVYIEWLRKANQILHGFLFDDFIRVISHEYIVYVHDCQQKDLRPLTGWHFYDEKVDEAKFTKSVIKRKNLSDALLSLDQGHVEKIRAHFSATSKLDDSRLRGSGTLSNARTVYQPSTPDASSIEKRRNLPWVRNTASEVNFPSSPPVMQNSPLYRRTSSAKPSASASTQSRSTPAKSTPTKSTRAQQIPNSPIINTESESRWRKTIESAKHKMKEERQSRDQVETSDNGRRTSEASTAKRKQEHYTEHIARPFKKSRVNQISTGSTNSFRAPFVVAPKPARVPKQNDTTTKVTGWLNKTKKSTTFKQILERRRQSGGLASRMSTPSSTPAKRFCTKPKQDADVTEPKTQAWNYD